MSQNKKPSKVLLYIQESLGYNSNANGGIRCAICSLCIKLNKNQGIFYLKRHEMSAGHMENIELLIENKNKDIESSFNASDIHDCIVEAFASAGISMNALDNEKMRF